MGHVEYDRQGVIVGHQLSDMVTAAIFGPFPGR